MLAILLIICARSVILSETKDLLFRRFFRFARAQRQNDGCACQNLSFWRTRRYSDR